MVNNEKNRSLALFFFIVVLCYFLIISFSRSKLEWYDMPMFPFLSIFCSYPIFLLGENFNFQINPVLNKAIFAVLLFFIPMYFAIRKSQKNEIPVDQKKLEILYEYAFRVSRDKIRPMNLTYLNANFERPLWFYKYIMEKRGYILKIDSQPHGHYPVGTNIVVADDTFKEYLFKRYKTKKIDQFHEALVITILNNK
jgi:hypothetical protein